MVSSTTTDHETPPGESRRRRASAERGFTRLRWWEFVPEAVLLVGLAAFLIDEPDAATSAFGSLRAVALMVVVAIGWLVARVVFGLFVRWPALRLAVFGAAAVGVLATVVLPAYDNTTVVETFPAASASATSSTSTTISPGVASSTTAPVAEPVVIGTGMLEGIDHRASGTVNLYRRPDGSHVVGLERIDVQPGPDYDVYVVPGSDRDELADAVRLDDLRGNQGTQFYEVEVATDLEAGPWTVLIWCETFSVPIANATPV